MIDSCAWSFLGGYLGLLPQESRGTLPLCGPLLLRINQEQSVTTHDFTWSFRELLLLACQKASAGLDGREQS